MNLEKFSVPVAIIISGGIIAGALYYSNLKINSQPIVNKTNDFAPKVAITMRPVSGDDHILGNPNASVVIVEYSDTECPYCKQFNTTMRRVMSEYGDTGKVAWVYRHFPIDSLHSKARKEAEAMECANELGGSAKFWQYENLIYETTTSNNTLDSSQLPAMAKIVGLDVKAFNTCLSSGKYAEKVQADYEDAVKAGGQGTPNSIIVAKDGTKTVIQGAQPYENVKSVLDAILQG